jgi:hypothetical protein
MSNIFKEISAKPNENYAFDDDIFDAFNLSDVVCTRILMEKNLAQAY